MTNQYPTAESVAAYLSKAMGKDVAVEGFERITGGYSRYMARFTLDTGEAFVMRADPPAGESILDTDRAREWAVLTAIDGDGGVKMPTPRYFDADGEVGAPALFIEQVAGNSLFSLSQEGGPEEHAQYIPRLAEAAASLHTLDTDVLPAELERPSSWDSYIDGELEVWRQAEAAHVESDPFMRLAASWLDSHRPPPAPLTMVHGDFQAPNILVDDETGDFKIIDWELTQVGDPRQDLGWWALAHVSQPPDLIEENVDDFYNAYRELTGLSEEVVNPATVAYFTVLASAKIFVGVISQTALMHRGESSAPSVAYMTSAVPMMHGVWIDSMRRAGGWSERSAS